ncbi:T9SS type A sorting domain-containing protein [uncultured Winogradskyella sp.]|uniref:T9SS type A sorting domain-containing protein n=1 Tax=uncultured Winogradskyella sp. TaxID=395353 RepID=UPI0026094129|nr:T9SS type A sorting domain-containing protein [uncultured Winogradskyella sp.]
MKRHTSFIVLVGLFMAFVNSQELTLQTNLDPAVSETSGLIFINNSLITHNDSENTNQLFEIDASNGNVIRTVTITNATNVDWEDITHDDTYIYIGDIGNNSGTRTNLKVYRILIADFFASNTVTADLINFSYNNQTNFTPSPFATDFDAEGLIHYNENLYIFTKNWVTTNTNIYMLPKTVGDYSISPMDTIIVEGLVSGAEFNPNNNAILLTGYDSNGAFIIELKDFSSGLFSNGSVSKIALSVPNNYSPQIEAVTVINEQDYYITAEQSTSNASGLYTFSTSTLGTSDLQLPKLSFYPNPANTIITLNTNNLKADIYDTSGQLIKTSEERHIDVSNISPGYYITKIEDKTNGNLVYKKLIIN